MALLDMLVQKPGLKLTVAHFDHGIREDSKHDRLLVQSMARYYGLPFVYDEGRLGSGVSEATARTARYRFLHGVRELAKADAIITAHHQDDLLETAILNLMRGTHRHGLSSLKSRPGVMRPLLHVPKQDIIDYAKQQRLLWQEDATNRDTTYLRNHIRHKVVPRFGELERMKFLAHIGVVKSLNRQIDHVVINYLHMQPAVDVLDRHWFVMLPHVVAREVLASWLRLRGIKDINKKQLERLVGVAKTLRPGKRADIDHSHYLQVEADKLALTHRDR